MKRKNTTGILFFALGGLLLTFGGIENVPVALITANIYIVGAAILFYMGEKE